MFQSVNNPKNKTLNIKLQNVIPHQSPAVQNLVHFAISRCCNMYRRSCCSEMINRMNMLQHSNGISWYSWGSTSNYQKLNPLRQRLLNQCHRLVYCCTSKICNAVLSPWTKLMKAAVASGICL